MQLFPSFSIISTRLRKFLEGVELFNCHDFFSAHDIFEELWVEADRENKMFFQGLVQISVGCYHLICKNYKGAVSQLEKGLSKLVSQNNPDDKKIKLDELVTELKYLLEEIENLKIDSDRNLDVNKLPTLKLTSKF